MLSQPKCIYGYILFSKIWENDDFAVDLAEKFMVLYPVEATEDYQKKKNLKKYQKSLNLLHKEAWEYSKDLKLNIYTKAKIGNKFMWRLKRAGYNEVLIQDLTTTLLSTLN